ncbi:hypothetical protein EXW52_28225 (plasmid) [Bacillus mycoides]|nr:hypothetical protein EXW52_28225 [Bacillus mycoides]QWH54367.1 hypothetical protein EXW44_30580 [Bacillus mycoides]
MLYSNKDGFKGNKLGFNHNKFGFKGNKLGFNHNKFGFKGNKFGCLTLAKIVLKVTSLVA